ncbi:hypothetical protein [Cumulibacter soli]|uniref:hypothetical protein n=1 Tax=Cumulibacter soli TaxID=2546344 RepID=UPI001068BF7C|nr:hypothetical protein [Cumulibacter soli]
MADNRSADGRHDDALSRRIARLEGQVSHLRQQALQLQFVLLTASAVLALFGIAVGLFLPFVRSVGGADGDSITLLPAIFALADAGGGPFETQAIIVAVLVGILALAALLTAVAIACLAEHPTVGRIKFASISGGILILGCAGAWLLVAVLAGRSDDLSAFSPATLSITIGAALTLVCVHLARTYHDEKHAA